ncbi:hypothetical protein ACE6H2_007327 [Prunus campanulata]
MHSFEYPKWIKRLSLKKTSSSSKSLLSSSIVNHNILDSQLVLLFFDDKTILEEGESNIMVVAMKTTGTKENAQSPVGSPASVNTHLAPIMASFCNYTY